MATNLNGLAPRETGPGHPVPFNEPARLQALEALKILDTPPDERFDRITRLAASHFRMPVVRITFVDNDRSWFKSSIGLKATEAPRSIALCAYTVMNAEPLIVADLSQDARFADSPQVAGKPHFRFYAGAPIILENNLRVGTVCLMDKVPHPEFTREDAAFLQDLAALVVHELELSRQVLERDESLVKLNRDLDIARNAKKRFLNIVNHELRTPLNGILGFGEMIAKEEVGPIENETYVSYANYVCDAAHRLRDLIERIITYTAADTSELRLVETTFEWNKLVADVSCTIAVEAAARSVSVSTLVAPDVPQFFFGDEVYLKEVLFQLSQNAISFTEPGGQIAIILGRKDDGSVVASVTDSGPGMAEEDLADLSAAFVQGDDRLSRRHGGLGLGLPVSKMLAELHGGRLELVSSKGRGTTAEVHLPAARNRTEPAAHETTPGGQ